jgi:hypothetical protein
MTAPFKLEEGAAKVNRRLLCVSLQDVVGEALCTMGGAGVLAAT